MYGGWDVDGRVSVRAGGKWICGVDVLRSRQCLVYSYGVNKDLSFELELIERTGCQVRHD
jgi:hypothetical protein